MSPRKWTSRIGFFEASNASFSRRRIAAVFWRAMSVCV